MQNVQEMKVHRIMIKLGISALQSSQGSAAGLGEVFCVYGPCLAVDALGLLCSCIPSSLPCCSPRHTHPRLGRSDSPGDDFCLQISGFFYVFGFRLPAVSFLLAEPWVLKAS